MNKFLRQTVFPVLAALIWGVAFSFQARCAAAGMGPFTFGFLRAAVGCAALGAIALIRAKGAKNLFSQLADAPYRKNLLVAGAVCGVILFVATFLQQAALSDTSGGTASGKVGFITALYIVLVPVLGLFFRRKASPLIWLCMLLAAVGMYFLCVKPGTAMTVSRYDLLALGCSITFAFHILAVDRLAPRVDGVQLSFMQFFVVMVLSVVPAFTLETPSPEVAFRCLWEILYMGVMSGGVGYTLQILAQQNTNPTVVSLLFSLESVFAMLTGVLFGERMTGREYLGCAVVLAAVVLSQIPLGRKHEKA